MLALYAEPWADSSPETQSVLLILSNSLATDSKQVEVLKKNQIEGDKFMSLNLEKPDALK